MFERDSEWRQFSHLITDTALSAEEISRNTQIPLSVVTGYRQQGNAKAGLDRSDIPNRLLRHAVGFRYLRLGRWNGTPAEVRARQDYDAGLVEVTQGKFKVNGEDAYVLFSIPRRTPKKGRALYFSAPSYS